MKKIIPNKGIFPKVLGLCFIFHFIFTTASDKNAIHISQELIRKNKIDSAIVYINQNISQSKSIVAKVQTKELLKQIQMVVIEKL